MFELCCIFRSSLFINQAILQKVALVKSLCFQPSTCWNIISCLLILLSVLLPGFILYFAKDSYQGISLGKWIMGIMVRDQNNLNKVPSFGRLFLRNLFLIIWPIEFLILATNKQNKRLGDTLTKAVVLKNPIRSSKSSRIIALISVVILFFVFIYDFYRRKHGEKLRCLQNCYRRNRK